MGSGPTLFPPSKDKLNHVVVCREQQNSTRNSQAANTVIAPDTTPVDSAYSFITETTPPLCIIHRVFTQDTLGGGGTGVAVVFPVKRVSGVKRHAAWSDYSVRGLRNHWRVLLFPANDHIV